MAVSGDALPEDLHAESRRCKR